LGLLTVLADFLSVLIYNRRRGSKSPNAKASIIEVKQGP
jgi:hypothetical protein